MFQWSKHCFIFRLSELTLKWPLENVLYLYAFVAQVKNKDTGTWLNSKTQNIKK